MSTKTVCDGCGNEIKPYKSGDPASDGLTRTVSLTTGNNCQRWDLCDPCQEKIAHAFIELLPSTPALSWWDRIRPKKHTS